MQSSREGQHNASPALLWYGKAHTAPPQRVLLSLEDVRHIVAEGHRGDLSHSRHLSKVFPLQSIEFRSHEGLPLLGDEERRLDLVKGDALLLQVPE